MIRTILISAIIFLSFGLNAQISYEFAISKGFETVAANSAIVLNNSVPTYKLTQTKANSYFVGVNAQIPVGPFYVKPGAEYKYYSTDYAINFYSEDGTSDVSKTETTHSVQIPLMFGLEGKRIFFESGPVVKFHLASAGDITELDAYSSDFNTTSLGLKGGIGVKIGSNMKLAAHYETLIGSQGDHMSIFETPVKFNSAPSTLRLGLGYTF